MKRYIISYAERVNEKASKSGISFYCRGRTDNPETTIEMFKNSKYDKGLRITDSQTKKIIFEEIRADKGCLTITYKSNFVKVEKYVDLEVMRYWEHWFKYESPNRNNIEKIERTIY